MRIFVWLWVIFLVLCIFFDGITVWSIRGQLSQGLELALDGGLIAGLSSRDLVKGHNYIEENVAQQTVNKLVAENLATDLKESLTLKISIDQNNQVARLTALASVRIPLLMTGFLGLEGYHLNVKKLMNYQGMYK